MGKTIYCLLFTHWRVVYQSCARMGLFEAVTGRQFIQCEMLEQTRHRKPLAGDMRIFDVHIMYAISRMRFGGDPYSRSRDGDCWSTWFSLEPHSRWSTGNWHCRPFVGVWRYSRRVTLE